MFPVCISADLGKAQSAQASVKILTVTAMPFVSVEAKHVWREQSGRSLQLSKQLLAELLGCRFQSGGAHIEDPALQQ